MSGLVDRLASQRARAALRTYEAPERKGSPLVRLDKGEAAAAPALGLRDLGDLNRFPDPLPAELIARMADLYGAPEACIALAADTADACEALVRIFRRPAAEESVVLATAGFEAAALAAELRGVQVFDAAAGPGEPFDPERAAATIREAGGATLVFLASPTHETGEVIKPEVVRSLVEAFPESLFVVDESYIEIALAPSLAPEAAESESLVVLRSLSRGYGLAGIGVGALVASGRIAQLVRALRAFRPLPTPSVRLALAALAPCQAPLQERRLQTLISERGRVAAALGRAPSVVQVRPSRASFLSVKVRDGIPLSRKLAERGIGVAWDDVVAGELRLTIGAPQDNDLALAAFGAQIAGRRHRIAEVARDTSETRISVRVDLDGAPRAKVSTGVGFFDHMLEQVAKHGVFDLTLVCEGDVHVDPHHTIEDCMLALGSALKAALGDKRGIERFAFHLPMDEADAEAKIDLSGRPYAVFQGEFTGSHIGDYPTEMTPHAFRSLAETLGAAIHIKVRGHNDHHKTEAAFKALGRTLRQAIRQEGDDLPSTKGVL